MQDCLDRQRYYSYFHAANAPQLTMQGKGNLLQDISTLDVSETFVSQSAAMALHTLADVMAADINRLRQHQEFSMTWYQQLLTILHQQGLLAEFEKKLR